MAIPTPEDYHLLVNNGSLSQVLLINAQTLLTGTEKLLTNFEGTTYQIALSKIQSITDVAEQAKYKFLLSNDKAYDAWFSAVLDLGNFPDENDYTQGVVDTGDFPDENDYTQLTISSFEETPDIKKVGLDLIYEYVKP